MIQELGYPKGLISVEKEVSSFSSFDPSRRIDILCFHPAGQGLKPLLLIECKAETLSEQAEKQAFGYNEAIGAPFIALASAKAVRTMWRERGRIASVPFLPSFDQLVSKI